MPQPAVSPDGPDRPAGKITETNRRRATASYHHPVSLPDATPGWMTSAGKPTDLPWEEAGAPASRAYRAAGFRRGRGITPGTRVLVEASAIGGSASLRAGRVPSHRRQGGAKALAFRPSAQIQSRHDEENRVFLQPVSVVDERSALDPPVSLLKHAQRLHQLSPTGRFLVRRALRHDRSRGPRCGVEGLAVLDARRPAAGDPVRRGGLRPRGLPSPA